MGEAREMVQEVGEKVKVLASFAGFKITIHFFSWRGRTYKVDSMNLFHVEKDAQHQIYNFAVSALGNTYQLTFDPVTLEWQLKDVLSL
ncbi:MAG: hypothetical protein NUV80_01595 [Candidatus Berkelbacteria bacterium]|nr:hypothetical protein [Candidatus Berkelbacteria bacterium]MCR4307236.1 hypothetical protein [Candidatus Berkelbacteria bacterium]